MNDFSYILEWFLAIFIIGGAFLPMTFTLFNNFKDKGYIFSKIIGMVFLGYFVLVSGVLRLVRFSQVSVIISVIVLLLINYFVFKKANVLANIKKHLKIFLFEEAVLLATLSFWSYVRSNMPDIHGLEKFMDFGFLNTILRSDYFPPKDMWYTPLTINYYYFGHLVTAVITKLTSIPSFISYNLMLATLFALTFTAAFSFATNLFDLDRFSVKSGLAGLIGAALVALGGNLTTIYAFFKPYVPATSPVPFWQLPFLPSTFPNNFWYPNATRFIPLTIHEFPIYSFVVSDLHGHVLDIPFVLLTISVMYSFFMSKKINLWNLVFLSFLFAVMYMTNAWDGLIYILLGLLFLAVFNFYKEDRWIFRRVGFYNFAVSLITFGLGFFIFSLPFSLFFKPFVSGVGVICAPTFLTNIGKIGPLLFEANHCQRSPLWQLVILYGFFYFFAISFIVYLRTKKNYKLSKNDIFVLILMFLSTVLIIVPEFIYVKDIYPTYYRANTMFKLVYESFIMLSICSAYILVKLLSGIKRKKILVPFFLITLSLCSLVMVYPFFAIGSYYNGLTTAKKSLDGISYLSYLYPGDYNLINWFNKNVQGQPVVLEANGDSYTDYARISANTGLPTVIGWPVHEWLWRGSWNVAAPRIEEVQTLYTTQDLSTAKSLIDKYHISYVVVSSLERQKYPELNEKNFALLGKVVYQSDGAKIYKINN